MKNYGFILKPDVFSLLQSKCHYLWIKLKETLLLKWYFHFKPNVFLSRDHVTSRQTALFDAEVHHCFFLASSADRKSWLSALCGNSLKQGNNSKLCCFSATCAFRVLIWSVAEWTTDIILKTEEWRMKTEDTQECHKSILSKEGLCNE